MVGKIVPVIQPPVEGRGNDGRCAVGGITGELMLVSDGEIRFDPVRYVIADDQGGRPGQGVGGIGVMICEYDRMDFAKDARAGDLQSSLQQGWKVEMPFCVDTIVPVHI